MEVAASDDRGLLDQAASCDVEGEPNELSVRPGQGSGRQGASARCKARLASRRPVIPDLLGQQITVVRGTAYGNKVRLRPKHVVSRQVVFTAFSGENWPQPAMSRQSVGCSPEPWGARGCFAVTVEVVAVPKGAV